MAFTFLSHLPATARKAVVYFAYPYYKNLAKVYNLYNHLILFIKICIPPVFVKSFPIALCNGPCNTILLINNFN